MIVTSNPATWIACKDLLISRYSDPSSEDLLFNKLSTCHQRQNQTYEKYADEIKYRLNKIKENVLLQNEDQNSINLKKTFYENIAKNTFINGILPPHRAHLTHFELDDIEACLVKCRQYDNHEQQAAFLDFVMQRENKSKSNIFNTTENSRKINLFGAPGTSKNTNSFVPTRVNPFNNSPVTLRNGNTFSYQPRPVATPTNFGSNAFGQNNQNRNYQPTPMSINTKNTNRPNNNNPPRPNKKSIAQNNTFTLRGNHFFRSTGPPNFIAEELHNQQEQQEEEAVDYQNETINQEEIYCEDSETTDHENFQQIVDIT